MPVVILFFVLVKSDDYFEMDEDSDAPKGSPFATIRSPKHWIRYPYGKLEAFKLKFKALVISDGDLCYGVIDTLKFSLPNFLFIFFRPVECHYKASTNLHNKIIKQSFAILDTYRL